MDNIKPEFLLDRRTITSGDRKQVRNRYSVAGLTKREQERIDKYISTLGNMSVKENLDVRIAALLSLAESHLYEALEIAQGRRQISEKYDGFIDEKYLIDPNLG